MNRCVASSRRFQSISIGLSLLACLACVRGVGAAEGDSPAVGPNIDLHDVAPRFLTRFFAERSASGAHSLSVGQGPGTDLPLEGTNEMVIAVNPVNPLNIAYASLWELRVTTDGGTTWQAPVVSKFPT